MADLLAKQDKKTLSLNRGQEVEGEVVSILGQEIILDLGLKAEGILQKRDLAPETAANLKVGDKLLTFVLVPENESGQVVLGLQKAILRGDKSLPRWAKFEEALQSNRSLTGKGLEINRGGLIVEVNGVRGFLPSSQVSLSQAAKLDELVGQDLTVNVIEVDPSQNRLIFSQKANITEDVKKKLTLLKIGEKVKGKVVAVLPFGVFVTLDGGVEGLVHISEIAWEKVEDPASLYKVGDEVEAQVQATDVNTGRVNLSVKQLATDPFLERAKDFQTDDIIKGEISRITSTGVFVSLEGGVEGLIHATKTEAETEYKVGESVTCLIDSVDNQKRRVNLVPFITSTKDLIYK